ncbi:MAG: hypothetical protein IPK07_13125 [Deltaproteobacteria bacterium]|nr:hypothetical protein [Deltaproteobacteria bacterium]
MIEQSIVAPMASMGPGNLPDSEKIGSPSEAGTGLDLGTGRAPLDPGGKETVS